MRDRLALDAAQLEQLAPYILQVINLSSLDPHFAASLVPDSWVAAAIESALEVEAEQPAVPSESEPPRTWPVGPWQSPESLVASIRGVEPGAVVGLYRALTPRLVRHCATRQTSAKGCERAIQVTASRLSSAAVVSRAVDRSPAPLTPTQMELARLGEDVVTALRSQIRAVGTTLWGPPTQP